MEKFAIIAYLNFKEFLNQRSKILNECRHKNK